MEDAIKIPWQRFGDRLVNDKSVQGAELWARLNPFVDGDGWARSSLWIAVSPSATHYNAGELGKPIVTERDETVDELQSLKMEANGIPATREV